MLRDANVPAETRGVTVDLLEAELEKLPIDADYLALAESKMIELREANSSLDGATVEALQALEAFCHRVREAVVRRA